MERLRAYGHFLGAYHTKIAPLVRAMDRERETDEAARATWRVAMARWRGGAARAVGELKEAQVLDARFTDPEDAIDLMYALMSVDLIRILVDERGWRAEKYGAYMAETFVALLVDGAAQPHTKRGAAPRGRRSPSRK